MSMPTTHFVKNDLFVAEVLHPFCHLPTENQNVFVRDPELRLRVINRVSILTFDGFSTLKNRTIWKAMTFCTTHVVQMSVKFTKNNSD